MRISTIKPLAKKIFFDKGKMWIELIDGRVIGIPLIYFPKLLKATQKQRQTYEISGGGIGLHWNTIDEDISVPNLMLGIYDRIHSHKTHKQKAA